MYAYERVYLIWPIIPGGPAAWELEVVGYVNGFHILGFNQCAQMRAIHVVDIDSVAIIPFTVCSPLFLRLRLGVTHDAANQRGICIRIVGSAVPLLEYALSQKIKIADSDLRFLLEHLAMAAPANANRESLIDRLAEIYCRKSNAGASNDEVASFVEKVRKKQQEDEEEPIWAQDALVDEVFNELPQNCKDELKEVDP